MVKKLSNSVKKKAVPKEEVLKALQKWAKEIRKKRKEILKIGLFGSYAKDTFGPASDLDILIILSSSDKPVTDRMSDYYPSDTPVGCELFIYTEDEAKKFEIEENKWFKGITKKIKWI